MVDVVRGDRLYSGLCLGTSTSATSPLAAAPARRLLSAPRAGVGGILSMRSYVGRAWSPGVEAVGAVSAGGIGRGPVRTAHPLTSRIPTTTSRHPRLAPASFAQTA